MVEMASAGPAVHDCHTTRSIGIRLAFEDSSGLFRDDCQTMRDVPLPCVRREQKL
jgi:hypothetical protein